eukprot:m.635911 g.635911  ORF g.635911 m.635911 type:complete len:72 (+) comp22588_c0_seq2:168-383(+)
MHPRKQVQHLFLHPATETEPLGSAHASLQCWCGITLVQQGGSLGKFLLPDLGSIHCNTTQGKKTLLVLKHP